MTAEQLQAEMDRMAKNTKDPGTLRELFAAKYVKVLPTEQELTREI